MIYKLHQSQCTQTVFRKKLRTAPHATTVLQAHRITPLTLSQFIINADQYLLKVYGATWLTQGTKGSTHVSPHTYP